MGYRADFVLKWEENCVVIELKRNGNVNMALIQAQSYSNKLKEVHLCIATCSIGINLAGSDI